MAEAIKIGVVPLKESYVNPCRPSKLKKIEQEFIPRDEEIGKMALQAKNLQDKLEEKWYDNGNERRNLERNLANLSRSINVHKDKCRISAPEQEYSTILERTGRAIDQIAEKERYDLIAQKDSVYRANARITDKVIQVLENE